METSAQVCPSATPAASARLCHNRRGRVGLDDGDDDGGGGWAPRLPAAEEAAPPPTMGQKAYTVFFGLRDRNPWRSSSVCVYMVFALQLLTAAAAAGRVFDDDKGRWDRRWQVRANGGARQQQQSSKMGLNVFPSRPTQGKKHGERGREKTCDNRDGSVHSTCRQQSIGLSVHVQQ